MLLPYQFCCIMMAGKLNSSFEYCGKNSLDDTVLVYHQIALNLAILLILIYELNMFSVLVNWEIFTFSP